jgi:hypothetical protein
LVSPVALPFTSTWLCDSATTSATSLLPTAILVTQRNSITCDSPTLRVRAAGTAVSRTVEGEVLRLTLFTTVPVSPVAQQSAAGEAVAAAIAFAGLAFAGAAAVFAVLAFPAATFGAVVFRVAVADFAAGAPTSTVTLTVVSTVALRPATWVSRRAAVWRIGVVGRTSWRDRGARAVFRSAAVVVFRSVIVTAAPFFAAGAAIATTGIPTIRNNVTIVVFGSRNSDLTRVRNPQSAIRNPQSEEWILLCI